MTLEELIEYAEKRSKATWNGRLTSSAEEHKQLAEWLKDYKRLLEQESCENAIKYFNTIYELSQTLGVSYDFVDEKIREAITALKVLPKEPYDDAISRQAAIKDICRHCTPEKPEKCPTAEICHIYQELKALPPVNLAEKVGQWIKIDDCSNSGYYCSKCHKKVVKEGWSDTVKIIKYCPNCGAKMRKVEE